MSAIMVLSATLLLLVIHLLVNVHVAKAATINPVVSSDQNGACPSQEVRDEIVQTIKASVQATLEDIYYYNPNCGAGLWHRVAHLNMTDPSQHCPSDWREYNSNGFRFCRRPEASSGSCAGTSYTTGQQYSKVCGRAIGYQYGGTDAFRPAETSETIDSFYVYGVSITHGLPRNHIWTFAAGVSEGDYSTQQYNCPCSDPGNSNNLLPPSFVGDNYYCESGNPASNVDARHLYSNDPLWDGQQCEGQCCSNGKSPPWFNVDLPSTTTDDIEVRICIGQPSYDDIALQLLEIYVK